MKRHKNVLVDGDEDCLFPNFITALGQTGTELLILCNGVIVHNIKVAFGKQGALVKLAMGIPKKGP